MKHAFILLLLITFGFKSASQINMLDSTAQVVGYWNKGEKKSYRIVLEKSKQKGKQILSKDSTVYEIDITLLEATDRYYSMEWHYKYIQTKSKDPLALKLYQIFKDLKVICRTDELGGFIEVSNWLEIKIKMEKAFSTLKKEFKSPEIAAALKSFENVFLTKEGIEQMGLKEIQQFYYFHGAKFKLNEKEETEIQVPNLLSQEPLFAKLTTELEKINLTDSTIELSALQKVDPAELTELLYNYLLRLSKTMKTPAPKKEELKNLKNEIHTKATINNQGWPVKCIQTKKISSGQYLNIDKSIIELLN